MLFGGPPQEEPVVPVSTGVPSHVPPELDEILQDKTLQWRCKQFLDAGFNIHQARRLTVDRSVDLHFVLYTLLARGCPVDVAFDIAA